MIVNTESRKRFCEDQRLLEAAVFETSEGLLITDGVWDDPGPTIVFVNPALCAMTGFRTEELIGKSMSVLYGPKSEHIPLSRIEADCAQCGAAIYQGVGYRRNGKEFLLELQVKPMRNAAGDVTNCLVFQRDVTERTRLREQIQQAQRMEAVGRLAGGIAHDFNNLLTIILGYSGLLATELALTLPPASKQIRSLNEIQLASEKAAALTGQLLAFSRKQVQRTRLIDLNPVIRNLECMLRRLLGEDIDLELTVCDEECIVRADPGQVEQMLMNLSVNARDAMPRGGMLTIQTRNADIAECYAPVTALRPGPYVVLSVTDTGTGMDEETRSRVFEPFFTTKESGRGTGLGLSMVYGFVAQSGGNVDVTSELGMGSCFNVYLPRIDSRVEVEAKPEAASLPRGTGVILVVEDEEGIRNLIREILESAGYEVLTAGNARQAIAIASMHPGPLDLLLADVVLPGISGLELAEQLVSMRPGMHVLFASGYSDHALLRHGNLERGAAFMRKPFDTETLLTSIRDLMGGKTFSQAS